MHLRDYQTDAVEAIGQTFTERRRAQLHAACGTGKTVIAIAVAEKLCPGPATIVFTVPTLALAAQVIETWRASTRVDAVLAVCSDETLTDSTVTLADLPAASTTDPAVISRWLAGAPGRRLIVATYLSAPLLGKVLRDTGACADLMICDEAHHLTGVRGRFTHQILHDEALPAARRLFMTATPRLDVAAADNGTGNSMSDEDLFGPVAYRFPWAAAIGQGYLDDYRVAVIGIAETDLVGMLNDTERDWVAADGSGRSLRTLAAQLACLKGARRFGLRRVIAFASRIHISKEFTRSLDRARELLSEAEACGPVRAVHLDGTASAAIRHRHLETLRHPPTDVAVLGNVRCLTEGVDVPSVDGLVFVNAKHSPADTIQAIGRALRPSPGGGGTATIVVPIVIPAAEHTHDIGDLDPKEWEVLWEVVRALRALDEDLAVRLDATRHADLGHPIELPERLVFDLPDGTDVRLAEHLRLLLIRHTTSTWQEGYNIAHAFAAEHGHLDIPAAHVESGFRLGHWIQTQRRRHRQGALDSGRVDALDAIGMIWDQRAHRWTILLERLRQFHSEHGHMDVPSQYRCSDGYRLGGRVIELRRHSDRIPETVRAELDALGLIWDTGARIWQALVDHLRSYRDEHGHTDVHRDYSCDDGYPLGARVIEARRARQSIPGFIMEQLEALGMIWDWHARQWEILLAAMRDFHAEHGHTLVPTGYTTPDGYTLGNRIQFVRRSRLKAPDYIRQQLDELGMVWDLEAFREQQLLDHVRAFKDEYGHTRIGNTYRSPDGYTLGDRLRWLRRGQRQLRPETRTALEALGFAWDRERQRWDDLADYLRAFSDEFGHHLVPGAYKRPDGYPLGSRIRNARRRVNDLPDYAVEALTAAGMVWDLEAHRWQRLVDHARDFHAEHGHLRIPKNYCSPDGYGLSNLLNKARRQREAIPDQTQRDLEALGIVWDVDAHRWEEFIDRLHAYAAEHGDLLVPRDYHCADGYFLGKRVSRVRTDPSVLPDDIRQQLGELGFTWDARAHRWDLLVERLQAFAAVHGHIDVPRDHRDSDGYRLGERLAWARTRTKPLPGHVHRALTELGIDPVAPAEEDQRS